MDTKNKIKKSRRAVELVVISDSHLGSIGSRAKELYVYLKNINPEKIVLNGDIIDIWQFKKRYWDKYHTKVIKELLNFATNGVEVYYIAGNHDEAFRRFLDFKFEGFTISNKLILHLDGKKAWFFHGDVFDITMQYSRWITRLGGFSYDFLIYINSITNRLLKFFGREKRSFSKIIKNKVKAAVSYINKFEDTVSHIAIDNQFDYVICGHIHQPCHKKVVTKKGSVEYLNSGDWIENLTALEYHKKKWTIFNFDSKPFDKESLTEIIYKNPDQLFADLVKEINVKLIQ
jgi:UDP-2,3-diacylglucosamine pyrophosphatase LpxH